MIGPWRRRPREVRLATDDRTEFRETDGSVDLTTTMLEAARDKAAELAPGAEFTVEVPRGHSSVHYGELGLGLMTRADGYGVQFVSQLDNTVTFRKT